jgi:hypothetical protein
MSTYSSAGINDLLRGVRRCSLEFDKPFQRTNRVIVLYVSSVTTRIAPLRTCGALNWVPSDATPSDDEGDSIFFVYCRSVPLSLSLASPAWSLPRGERGCDTDQEEQGGGGDDDDAEGRRAGDHEACCQEHRAPSRPPPVAPSPAPAASVRLEGWRTTGCTCREDLITGHCFAPAMACRPPFFYGYTLEPIKKYTNIVRPFTSVTVPIARQLLTTAGRRSGREHTEATHEIRLA